MIAELGAGGHGQVVSARTMATGRLVAIKSHADPHGIIIFQNEVRMLRFVGESEENR
jgi:serine/threonine protein kinase